MIGNYNGLLIYCNFYGDIDICRRYGEGMMSVSVEKSLMYMYRSATIQMNLMGGVVTFVYGLRCLITCLS